MRHARKKLRERYRVNRINLLNLLCMAHENSTGNYFASEKYNRYGSAISGKESQ
jgi:hypothetical protein